MSHGARSGRGQVQDSYSNHQPSQKFNRDKPYHDRSGQQQNSFFQSKGDQHFQAGGNYQSYSDRGYHGYQGQYDRVNDVEISKEIVRIVRHGKYKWIKMDSEGYVQVNAILNDRKFQNVCGRVTLDDVQRVVNQNDKKRFELKKIGSELYIKATQGHTVHVESLALTPVKDAALYPKVFHGTYFYNWEGIKRNGLNRMQRNHIHFAIGMADDPKVISGMRKDCEIAIEIDMEKALKAGLKFFISSNEVILCEGDAEGRIHPKFFDRVVQIRPFRMLKFDVPPDYEDGLVKDEKQLASNHQQSGSYETTDSHQSKPQKDFFDDDADAVIKASEMQLESKESESNEKQPDEKQEQLQLESSEKTDSAQSTSVIEKQTGENESAEPKKGRSRKRNKKKKQDDSSNEAPAEPIKQTTFEMPGAYNEKKKKEKNKEKEIKGAKEAVVSVPENNARKSKQQDKKMQAQSKTEPVFELPKAQSKKSDESLKNSNKNKKKDNPHKAKQKQSNNNENENGDKSSAANQDAPTQNSQSSSRRKKKKN